MICSRISVSVSARAFAQRSLLASVDSHASGTDGLRVRSCSVACYRKAVPAPVNAAESRWYSLVDAVPLPATVSVTPSS